MKYDTVIKIIDMMNKEVDKMTDKQILDLEYQFSKLKNIASKFEHENVFCYINLYYVNGQAKNGICLITDKEPGGITYYTPQNSPERISLPVFQLVYPEDWDEWLKNYGTLFDPEFPPYTEEA